MPEEWAKTRYEVHLEWNSSCEGSLYDAQGKMITGITENVREIYKIKTDTKNDGENLTYFIEIACQQMLGNFNTEEPWGGILNMDKYFTLKKCAIKLVDAKMERYFYDILTLRDAAKALKD